MSEWSGYKQRSKVAIWLRHNGIQFLIGADGWPRVKRDQAIALSKPLKNSEPNVQGLKDMQRR